MRHLWFPIAASLLLAACGQESYPGCKGAACDGEEDPGCTVGESVECTCADGSVGTKACGAATCVCATPPECALRHAAALDLGGVPPGLAVEGELALSNEGGAACEVSGIRLDGCGDAFGLAATFASVTVPAGGSAAIPVSFRALDTAPASCSLAFDSSDPASPARTVTLSGHADPGCLSVGPTSLAFSLEVAGCGTDEGTVTVANGCGVPLRLDGLSLAGGDFLLLAAPPLPATVAPGAELPVVVAYRPATSGNHEAALAVALAGLEPFSVALAGTAGEATWTTDTFQQRPAPQVDLLFVIDNGSSMGDDAENLAANLRPFLSFVQAQDVDLHLAVTTTGLAAGGDCPGGVGGGEDGRLFPVVGATPRVLDGETPDLEAAWITNFSVGACREGPNQALEAAVRALTPPLEDATDDPRHGEVNDGNAGFLRPEAHLSVVVITDRPDTSPESPNYYYNALQALKGFRNTHLFNFHAVTGGRGAGCGGDGERSAGPGDRLIDVVEKTDGGVFASICEPSWIEDFREMSNAAGEFDACFFLVERPIDRNGDGELLDTDGELAVSVDGEEVPSRGPQGQIVWSYRDEMNAVCFGPLAVPGYGSTIEIDYLPRCP